MFIRSELHRRGFRFRVNYTKIAVKPDLYFTKKKVAIFIHGCYWHQHSGCKYTNIPKSNSEYWVNKLAKNRIRDEGIVRDLIAQKIRILIIWECAVKKMQKDENYRKEIFNDIADFILSNTRMELDIQ